MPNVIYKEISKNNLLYANALLGKSQEFAFTIPDGTQASLSFQDTPSHYLPSIGMQLKVGNEPLEFWLDAFPLLKHFHACFNDLTWETVPNELKTILLESIAQPILTSLQTVFQKPFLMELLLTVPSEKLPRYFFSINAHQQAPVTYQGHIACSESFFIDYLLPKISLASTYIPIESDIPFSFAIEIGETSLKKQDFCKLAEQDIILIDNDELALKNHVLLRSKAGISYQARLENNHLTILSTMSQTTPENDNLDSISEDIDNEEEYSLDDSDSPTDGREVNEVNNKDTTLNSSQAPASPPAIRPTETKQALSLETLPIVLRFEVGKQTISLKDLQMIKEGFIFETQHSLSKPVDILANGKKIAVGELVKFNDHLGVRMIERSR